MAQCTYHPEVEAVTECQRCKRPICEADKRSYLSAESSDSRPTRANRVFILCPLCVTMEQAEDSSMGIIIASVAGIAYLAILVVSLIKGRVVVFGSILVLVIIGVVTLLFFLLALFGGRRERKKARADMLKFLGGLQWKTAGNVNVTVNELLGLPPDKLKERGREIYNELINFFPVSGLKEHAFMKKSLERNQWTLDDLGLMFTYIKKNIEYWSWRRDLSEASQNRVAYAFAYLIAVEHVGKEEADKIAKSAPPGFVQADILPRIFQDYS